MVPGKKPWWLQNSGIKLKIRVQNLKFKINAWFLDAKEIILIY